MTRTYEPGRHWAMITGHGYENTDRLTTHFSIRFRIVCPLEGEHSGIVCQAHERSIRYRLWEEPDMSELKAILGAKGLDLTDLTRLQNNDSISLVGKSMEVEVYHDSEERFRAVGGQPMCATPDGALGI